MKTRFSGVLLYAVFMLSAHGDSLLTPQQFPKTVKDLSFTERMELLAEGYAPYEIVYNENELYSALKEILGLYDVLFKISERGVSFCNL